MNATHPDVALGGVLQNGSMTKANFLDILAILLVVEGSPIRVQERTSSHIVSRTEVPLETVVYDIYSEGMCYVSPIDKAAQLLIPAASIQVSDEPWIHRCMILLTKSVVERIISVMKSVTATGNA